MRVGRRFFETVANPAIASLVYGGRAATVNGVAPDRTPAQFTFVDQTDADLSTVYTSAAITISGMTTGESITVTATGGTIDKNASGSFASSQIATNGDTIRARVTSSSSNSTAVSCVVNANGVSDTFSVTTEAAALDERPSPDNTGYTSPLASLTVLTGDRTISVNGTVMEGFHLTGSLRINASNVTVRNFLITASTGSDGQRQRKGIEIDPGHTNILIEDGEIEGARDSGCAHCEGTTCRRLYIHNMGSDAFQSFDEGNTLIEACYITDCGYSPNSHADGFQIGGGSNITVRGNYFNMPGNNPNYNNSQIFLIKPDFGAINNILIEGNWLNGGGYSVNMAGASTNVRIRNNRFGREYNFGPFSLSGTPQVCGNVWDDTGAYLTGNSACTV